MLRKWRDLDRKRKKKKKNLSENIERQSHRSRNCGQPEFQNVKFQEEETSSAIKFNLTGLNRLRPVLKRNSFNDMNKTYNYQWILFCSHSVLSLHLMLCVSDFSQFLLKNISVFFKGDQFKVTFICFYCLHASSSFNLSLLRRHCCLQFTVHKLT